MPLNKIHDSRPRYYNDLSFYNGNDKIIRKEKNKNENKNEVNLY